MCTGIYCNKVTIGSSIVKSNTTNCNGMIVYSGFTKSEDRSTPGVNKVTVHAYLYASKGLVGSWGFGVKINGSWIRGTTHTINIDTCNSSAGYNHAEFILLGSSTFEHRGTSSAQIPLYLIHGDGNAGYNGFRFWHIVDQKWYICNISIDTSITIQGAIPVNTKPNKPPIYLEGATQCPNGYKVVEDKFTARIGTATDPNGDAISRYRISWEKYVNNSWIPVHPGGIIYEQSKIGSVSVDAKIIPRGTQLRLLGDAKDPGGLVSDWNHSETFRRNSLPPLPTITNPTSNSYFYYDDINFEWSSVSDPDGSTVSYSIEVSVNDGAYRLLGSTQENKYNYKITNKAEKEIGTRFKFKITTSDNLCSAGDIYTHYFTKGDTRPLAPTNIQPSGGVYLDKVTLSWNHTTDTNNEGISEYIVYINSVEVGRVAYNSRVLPSYNWTIPSAEHPGSTFLVSVLAIDGAGNEGHLGFAQNPFSKTYKLDGTISTYLSGLTAQTETGTVFNSNIYINYRYNTAPHETVKKVQFIVQSSLNYGPWIDHGTGSVSSTENVNTDLRINLSNSYSYKHGDTIRCRVQVRDIFGQTTSFKETEIWIYYNTVPIPRIEYPRINSNIYNSKSNICMQIDGNEKYFNSYIEVYENNTLYNNKANTINNTFNNSFSSYYSYGKIVYTCQNLNKTNNFANKLKIRKVVEFNGNDANGNSISKTLYSAYTERDVIVTDYKAIVGNPDFIYANYYNEMKNVLNSVCSSYGQNNVNGMSSINPGNYIVYNDIFPPLLEAINRTRRFINSYDNRTNKTTDDLSLPLKDGNYIYKADYHNKIIEYICNI